MAALLLGASVATVAVRGAAAGHCWDWARVQDNGLSCGGTSKNECTCPHGTWKYSCEDEFDVEYHSCKPDEETVASGTRFTTKCMDWSDVLDKGWTCGGNYDASCTCSSGKEQHSCTYNGRSHYSCKDKGSSGTRRRRPSSDIGEAQTEGCTCTEACRDEEWCYADCDDWGWDYCKPGDGSSPSPSPSPSGKSLGQFMADFVKSQDGKYVYSEIQGSATCWDLARRAMEKARDAGYHFNHGQSSYVWSEMVVDIRDAQPGDIAQFQGWHEKITRPDGSWTTRSAWNPHTAVVVEPWNEGECALPTMDQNPDPVHSSDYHPCYKTTGSVIIYRIVDRSPSRLYSAGLPRLLRRAGAPAALALGALLAALAALAGVALKRFRARPWLADSAGDAEQAFVADQDGDGPDGDAN